MLKQPQRGVDMEPSSETGRRRCARCRRPESHCLCAAIPRVPSDTSVIVIQHPSEAEHALNTARLLVLGLCNATLVTAETLSPELEALLLDPTWHTELLFPSPSASLISPHLSHAKPRRLVLLDGTWRKARKLLHLNSVLRSLPHVELPSGIPSRYRLRKAPAAGALSTIEAGVAALTIIEPATNFNPILRPFEVLIEGQITAMGIHTYQQNHPES